MTKKKECADGTINVEFRVSPDGRLFRYYENLWVAVEKEELLYYPEGGYWTCPRMSGYYSSLEECERAALVDLSWLNST